MPAYNPYLITSALVAAFFILKWNVFPRVSARLPARNFLVAVLCGLALFNLHIYHGFVTGRTEVFLSASPDERKFEELRRALPAQGYVGFISDKPRRGSTESLLRYFHTQYALAPVVLVEGTSQNLIVGNFEQFDPELIPGDLVLVRVFGPGLMLFRKRDQ